MSMVYESEKAMVTAFPDLRLKDWIQMETRLLNMAASPGLLRGLFYLLSVKTSEGTLLRYFEFGK